MGRIPVQRIRERLFGKTSLQFVNYVLIGGLGVLINSAITVLLTEFFLGRQNYLYAFMVGTAVNLIYNFAMYSKFVFKSRGVSGGKKAFFFSYSLLAVILQLILTAALVGKVGVDLYLPAIILVIGIVAVLNFLVFKHFVFSKSTRQNIPIKPLWVILASFAFLSLSLILFWKTLFWDSAVYIAMGKYFFSAGELGLYEPFRPPLLPLLLGIFWRLNISPFLAGNFLVILASLGSVTLTYLIGRELLGERSGLFAAALLAISPTFVFYSSRILTDNLSVFLVLLALFLQLKKRSPILIGAVAGLATLTRFPNGLVLVALGIYSAIEYLKTKNTAEFVKYNLLLGLGFLSVMTPYLAYNFVEFGDPLHPFIEGSKIIGHVGESISEGILFYPEYLVLESITLLTLLPIAIYFLARTGPKKNPQLWTYLALSVLFLIYLTTLARKEMRYLVIILPLLYLLASSALGQLKLPEQKKKLLMASLILIGLVQLGLGLWGYHEGYIYPQDSEVFSALYSSQPSGLVVASSPVLAAYSDYPVEVIYYIGPQAYEYFRTYDPTEYRINTCELFCPEGDFDCLSNRETFLGKLSDNFDVRFYKSINDCEYYVFAKKPD